MPASKRFQGFLFDLDGTLLDTAPDLLAALNHLLRKNYKPELIENDVRGAISDGSNGLIELALGINSSAPEFNSLKLEFLDYYRLNLFQNTRPFPGIDEILIKIEQSKRPWGIVTSKLSNFTIPLVEHFRWDLRAKCVVCGDTLKQNKPDPAPLLEGAKYLGLSPNECLYTVMPSLMFKLLKQLACKLLQQVMDTSQMTKPQKMGVRWLYRKSR